VVVELVPWSEHVESRFTTEFADQVTYMAQRCDKTSIDCTFRIAWVLVLWPEDFDPQGIKSMI
jgi:hypothetical protein